MKICLYFIHQQKSKVYLFYEDIKFNAGEISWHLLNCVYERDSNLKANLCKAPRLTYETLHTPSRNKLVLL